MDKCTRRKSLLKCGRRSRGRSLGPVVNSDLCERIPLSLPPEERLEKLVKSAFELTMRNVGPEFSAETGVDLGDFIDPSKLYEDIDKQLKEKNLYETAVAESLHERCDDADCVECQEIEEYSNTISKLQHESDEWNRIFSSEREKLQDVVSAPHSPVEHEVVDDKYCYSSIWNKVDDMSITIECLAKEFASACDTFAYTLKLADASAKKVHSQISGRMDVAAFETPRSLIAHMTMKDNVFNSRS